MAKKKKRVGFTQGEMNTSSGFLDDVDIRFDDCKFLVTDYGGKAPESVVFQSTLFDLETEQGNDQMWKVSGGPTDWELEPTGDDELIPLTKKAEKGVHVACKFGQLITSLINAGIPDKYLDGAASSLEGIEAHVIRVENKNAMKDEEGNKKKDEVIIVDKILSLPGGENVAGESKGKGKAKEEDSNEDNDGADSSEEKAVQFVSGVIEEKGEVAKKDLPKIAFSAIEDEDARNEVLELVFSDEFLKEKSRPWNYKNGIVSAK